MKWAVAEKTIVYSDELTVFSENNPLVHLEMARFGVVEQCWIAQLANLMYTIKCQVVHTQSAPEHIYWTGIGLSAGGALPFEKYFNAVATSWCNRERNIIQNETCLSLLLIVICEFHFVVVVNFQFLVEATV